ncbi:hypothetical protein AB1Y20_000970 [Prymnesium parvum]
MVSAPDLPATYNAAGFDQVVMKTYGRLQLAVERGEGCYLWDSSGKKYLDFCAGIATCCLGHANSRLIEAISKQIRTVHHVSNLYYIPNQGELASKLVATSCHDKVFFCNSGAEANEAAIKLARKYGHTVLGADVPVVITALQSFHGRTLGTITATGQTKYQKNFGPLVPGFEYVPYNDVEALEALVKKINGGGPLSGLRRKKRKVAAILLEPLQGEGGITPSTKEFFQAARRLCDETGALLMADEVQTGMGRTGKFWGYQQHGVEVDVLTTAKALGGGVPIGAMMCKDACNVFQPGDHASTYGGNPLACAAGLAVMDAFEQDKLLENVQARGDQLRKGLDAMAARLGKGVVKEVRGWGLIVGVELSADTTFLAADVGAALLEAGMLTVAAGPKVVRLVPPLVVTKDQIDGALATLEAVLVKLGA